MQNQNENTSLQIAYQEMENYFLSPAEPVAPDTSPRFIFVFSSPGVGKSQTFKPILNRTFKSHPVNLEIDELKSFIPKDAKEPAKIANIWFQKIIHKAMSKNLNIIIFRQRNLLMLNQTHQLLKEASNNGYDTETDFIALDKKKSRLSLFRRYEDALAIKTPSRSNYPRKPDLFSHYIFYKALPIALNFCQSLKNNRIVKVYNRDGYLLSYLDKKLNIRSPISPLRALFKERYRTWSENEKENYKKQKRETLESLKTHASFKDILKFRLLVR